MTFTKDNVWKNEGGDIKIRVFESANEDGSLLVEIWEDGKEEYGIILDEEEMEDILKILKEEKRMRKKERQKANEG